MSGVIESISDTARWVAAYRAQESERPDALFADPFARRLAGERGFEIVRTLRAGSRSTWALAVRTRVLDDVIAQLVAGDEIHAVVNLAAGLDSRPYRMSLPSGLRWVEVDLPGILDYKQQILAGETPRCQYEAVRADLADPAARGACLDRLAAELPRALVITEGLLVYLTPQQAGELATDLSARASFRLWLVDLVGPFVLRAMQGLWNRTLAGGNAPMRFGPWQSGAFFAPFGWREREFRSFVDASMALKREMPAPWRWLARAGIKASWPRQRERVTRFAGAALFERASA